MDGVAQADSTRAATSAAGSLHRRRSVVGGEEAFADILQEITVRLLGLGRLQHLECLVAAIQDGPSSWCPMELVDTCSK